MSNYYASIASKAPGEPPPTLIIGGENITAFDAKQYAVRVLGNEGLLFQQTGDDAKPDVELRWAGNDYSAGGTPDGKHMQLRKRTKKGWGEWKDLK